MCVWNKQIKGDTKKTGRLKPSGFLFSASRAKPVPTAKNSTPEAL
jgi:hypothetical protein